MNINVIYRRQKWQKGCVSLNRFDRNKCICTRYVASTWNILFFFLICSFSFSLLKISLQMITSNQNTPATCIKNNHFSSIIYVQCVISCQSIRHNNEFYLKMVHVLIIGRVTLIDKCCNDSTKCWVNQFVYQSHWIWVNLKICLKMYVVACLLYGLLN